MFDHVGNHARRHARLGNVKKKTLSSIHKMWFSAKGYRKLAYDLWNRIYQHSVWKSEKSLISQLFCSEVSIKIYRFYMCHFLARKFKCDIFWLFCNTVISKSIQSYFAFISLKYVNSKIRLRFFRSFRTFWIMNYISVEKKITKVS